MMRDVAKDKALNDFKGLVGKLSGAAYNQGSSRGICDEEEAAEVAAYEAQIRAAFEQAEARAERLELELRTAVMVILQAYRRIKDIAPKEATVPMLDFIKPRLSPLREEALAAKEEER